jgi:hypothetical protein
LASQPAWRRSAKVDALHCALSIVPIALSCCRPRQSPDGNAGGAMPSMFAEAGDRDALPAFDFPAEHWKHLTTTNLVTHSRQCPPFQGEVS